jgi:arsenate reductase (thioredoxin)
MADGYLKLFAGDQAIIKSAGVETHGVNPRAISIMQEDGVDISTHTSNHVDEYASIDFDFVITVCDHARERCPVYFGRAAKFHYNFPYPARATGSEEEIRQAFRSTRNLIKDYCRNFVVQHLTT